MLALTLPTSIGHFPSSREGKGHFDDEGCSQPDVRGKGLPALDGQRPKHSMKNLVGSLLPAEERRFFQDGLHSALEDSRATMTLYLWHRAYI